MLSVLHDPPLLGLRGNIPSFPGLQDLVNGATAFKTGQCSDNNVQSVRAAAFLRTISTLSFLQLMTFAFALVGRCLVKLMRYRT
ncbi:hypothetical protein CW358_15420 [Pseudomonas protegens]|nr:hypothetical protein CW358_15420 [Pseudomonas protegens]